MRLSEAELLILLNQGKIVTKGDVDQHSEAVARVNFLKKWGRFDWKPRRLFAPSLHKREEDRGRL